MTHREEQLIVKRIDNIEEKLNKTNERLDKLEEWLKNNNV